jgi:hypothetical protein
MSPGANTRTDELRPMQPKVKIANATSHRMIETAFLKLLARVPGLASVSSWMSTRDTAGR